MWLCIYVALLLDYAACLQHANIQILELEHPTVQMLMTKLRDVSIEGSFINNNGLV